MKKLFAAAFAFALSISAAYAQSAPGWSQNYVPTPAEWNAVFASKQDFLGSSPLLVTGGVMTGELATAPSTASTAGFNIPPGVAPTAPINGDLWSTNSGLFVRINGTTIGPLAQGSGGSFAATSPLSVTFPSSVVTYACVTCAVTTNPLSQFAATTSAQLRGVLSDETGTGLAVFQNGALGSPTASTLALNGATLGSNTLAVNGPTALGGAVTATSLAIGGATLGSNALVVTGTTALSGAMSLGGALTYGGVTLANSVTGTGSMVLATAPSVSSLTVSTAFTATGLVTFADMATAALATQAQFFSGAANTVVPTNVIYTSEVTITFAAAQTIDFSTFINAVITLTANMTSMTLTNVPAGKAGQIRFIQDGTGSRLFTGTWPSIFKFAGGATPTLSTAAGAVDALEYNCTIAATYCVASLINNVK